MFERLQESVPTRVLNVHMHAPALTQVFLLFCAQAYHLLNGGLSYNGIIFDQISLPKFDASLKPHGNVSTLFFYAILRLFCASGYEAR